MTATSTLRLLIFSALLLLIVGIAGVVLFLKGGDASSELGNIDAVNATPATFVPVLASNHPTEEEHENDHDRTIYVIEIENVTTPATPTVTIESSIPDSSPESEVDAVDDLESCKLRHRNLSKEQCSPPLPRQIIATGPVGDFITQTPLLYLHNEPLHYDVQFRIENKNEKFFGGEVHAFLKVHKRTDILALHADRTIGDLSDERIAVFKCSTGTQICVRSVTKLIDQQLLILSLTEEVAEGTLLSIEVPHFETVIPINAGLFVQKPEQWERDRSWIIGSFFEKSGARSVFPCIDEKIARATFTLCLIHPEGIQARSNMPIDRSTKMQGLTETCFEETPAINPFQYGFVMFDNLQNIGGENSSSPVEAFVGKHLDSTGSQWILSETQGVVESMHQFTKTPLAVPKISIVSSLIEAEATHSLGLVVVKANWIEYPKYALPHLILTRQIVEQWISSVLTICEAGTNFCAQDGLAAYLEWKISAQKTELNMTTTRRLTEARSHAIATAAEKMKLRFTHGALHNDASECADRAAMVYQTVENIFGQAKMLAFIEQLFRNFAGKKCATIDDVANELEAATNSSVSKHMFLSFAKNTGYPIVRVEHEASGILTLGHSVYGNRTVPFTFSIDVLDDQRRKTHHIVNEHDVRMNRPSRFVVIDPDKQGYQRTVYNPESYENMITCLTTPETCPVQANLVHTAFNDMCWAFLENVLDTTTERTARWHSLFGKLTSLTWSFDTDCRCCMQSQSTATGACKWTWRDKCASLNIANRS